MDNSFNPEIRWNRKTSRRSDEDSISRLPDSLLQHILSFVSTSDAVRTSVLSLRWRNIWRFVPCLVLDSDEFFDEDDFLSFMDRLLDFYGNLYLQKLVVKTVFPVNVGYCFEAWIKAAIMCKVEHVEVEYDGPEGDVYLNKMPQCLCQCNTLVVLKLKLANLDIPKLVSLSSLKIMHLEDVAFMDAGDLAFKSLIFGCPVLEELSISRSFEDNLKVLSICSQTLKRLRIHVQEFQYPGGRENGMVIDAPHLQDLVLYDRQSEDFVIRNSGSFKADIEINFNEHDRYDLRAGVIQKITNIHRFLTGISDVKSLIISGVTLKILSEYRRLEALPQFPNLFHLEVRFQQKKGWGVLPAFFKCCPNLKTFVMGPAHNVPKLNPFRPLLATPQCLLSSLESITLRMSSTNEMVMDMVKYFLENSAVLKKMTVVSSWKHNLEKELLISKQLLMFPRLSSACRVYVEPSSPT